MNKLDPKKVRHRLYDQDEGYLIFEFIFVEDIPERYVDEFTTWMRGQTCPVIEVDGESKMAVYWHDWIRWYQYKTGKAKFLIWD